MRFGAVDYGAKRVGLALSDEQGNIAFPDSVILNDPKFFDEIKAWLIRKKIEAVVVGESKDLDGRENPIMAEIRSFAKRLVREIGLPVYFEPEFYSSTEAARVTGKNKMHDASAAALILRNYLERNKNHGNN